MDQVLDGRRLCLQAAQVDDRYGQVLLLISPGTLAFLDLARSPGKQRGRADRIWPLLQGDTAGRLGVFQIVNVGEMAVDQRCVGEQPQMLGRLELRRIGWQKEQVNVI